MLKAEKNPIQKCITMEEFPQPGDLDLWLHWKRSDALSRGHMFKSCRIEKCFVGIISCKRDTKLSS